MFGLGQGNVIYVLSLYVTEENKEIAQKACAEYQVAGGQRVSAHPGDTLNFTISLDLGIGDRGLPMLDLASKLKQLGLKSTCRSTTGKLLTWFVAKSMLTKLRMLENNA